MMKTDTDCQLDAGNRWQVSSSPLHGDSRLTSFIGVTEERRQVVSPGSDDSAVKAVDTARHALHAPVNRVQGLSTAELAK
jgi:hypothetical protein